MTESYSLREMYRVLLSYLSSAIQTAFAFIINKLQEP